MQPDPQASQAEYQALTVMKDVAEVLKTAVTIGAQAPDGAADMSGVCARINAVLGPLEELNARGAFSPSTAASFEKLRAMVNALDSAGEGSGGEPAAATNTTTVDDYSEDDEEDEDDDDDDDDEDDDEEEGGAGYAEADDSEAGQRDQIQQFLTMLLLQIGKLHKLNIIDDEMRGILKDLLIIGQLKQVSDALNDIKQAALDAVREK